MESIRTSILISNPSNSTIKPVEVRARVDTGVMYLCIPQHVARQLRLEQNAEREVTTADGHQRPVPYVGPVEVRFNNRRCYVGALVLGDEVFLGAIPLEDMDLAVSPSGQGVVVNPESPNIPSAIIKIGDLLRCDMILRVLFPHNPEVTGRWPTHVHTRFRPNPVAYMKRRGTNAVVRYLRGSWGGGSAA